MDLLIYWYPSQIYKALRNMQLIEISGLLTIDPGAPTPTIISQEYNLYLIFYGVHSYREELHERNSVYDTGIFVMKFNSPLQFKFGMPSNETIQGHPFYKLGLRSYSFYKVIDSEWIKELKKIDMVHPSFNNNRWENYSHFILTFHDNMFECIASDFEIKEEKSSIYNQVSTLLNEMNANSF